MKIMPFFLLILCCSITLPLNAAMHWTEAVDTGVAGHGRHAAPVMVLAGADTNAVVNLWQPTLNRIALDENKGGYRIAPTGMANYHALVAQVETASLSALAVRYQFMFGKPSGESPALLVNAEKGTLELVPSPLPREHWRYESGDSAEFILRFKGQPLPSAPVSLRTSFGSVVLLTTDDQGLLHLKIPEDFTNIQPGQENNKPAEFVLSSAIEREGRRYETAISAPYQVNPLAWQLRQAGVAVLSFGFVGGLLLMRFNRPVKGNKSR